MLRDQQEKFKDFKDDSKLFMLNWTLTPMSPDDYQKLLKEANPLHSITPGFIGSIASNVASLTISESVKAYAEQINPRLAEGLRPGHPLAERNAKGKLVNIINCDFVELAHAVPVCLDMMRRNPPVTKPS